MNNGRHKIEDVIRDNIEAVLMGSYTNIPAIVESFNTTTQLVDVKVATEVPTYIGKNIPPHRLIGVPLIFPQGSDWVIAGPIAKGDAVWLSIPHHGIQEYLDGFKDKVGLPVRVRRHDISQAVAFPGMFTYNGPTRKTALKDKFHIGQDQNYTSMDSDEGIRHYSTKTVHVQAIETVIIKCGASTITLNPDGTVIVDSTTATFTGDVQVDGTLTATTDVIGGGKSLKSHTHDGVNGETSAPL